MWVWFLIRYMQWQHHVATHFVKPNGYFTLQLGYESQSILNAQPKKLQIILSTLWNICNKCPLVSETIFKCGQGNMHTKSLKFLASLQSEVHNIIQIHISVLWDWHYFAKYSPHSDWMWEIFCRVLLDSWNIDMDLENIPHIQIECGEYFTKYCQSHITLLWIWIMLCGHKPIICTKICGHSSYLDTYT